MLGTGSAPCFVSLLQTTVGANAASHSSLVSATPHLFIAHVVVNVNKYRSAVLVGSWYSVLCLASTTFGDIREFNTRSTCGTALDLCLHNHIIASMVTSWRWVNWNGWLISSPSYTAVIGLSTMLPRGCKLKVSDSSSTCCCCNHQLQVCAMHI